jgi:hypothetical protein
LNFNRAIDDFSADEKAGQKLVIGGLVMSVPILNIAATGYEVRVARQVARSASGVLPEWDDPAPLLLDGLGLVLARAAYALPAAGVMAAALLAALPPLAALGGNSTVEGVPPRLWLLLLLLGGLVLSLLLAYSLLLSLLSPAIRAQFVRHGTFAACFDLPEMWRFARGNLRAYLKTWAALLAVGLAVSLAAAVVSGALRFVPCFGTPLNIVAIGWLAFGRQLLRAHFTGQLVQADAARMV